MDEISRDETLELLNSAPVAHLGMVENGEPYVVPMSFVLVGDRILFRTMAGRKLDAIKSNPAVCLEVTDLDEKSGSWVSVIVKGRAEEVFDDDLKSETVSRLLRKYEEVIGSPLSRNGGLRAIAGLPHVVAMTLDQVSGLSSGRGWSARIRPGRL
jgi:nitroimidazol reductase NimA-like FMN-containing flavoprotein (pyridoxamine 5'-phosphate oxidase superfamily)